MAAILDVDKHATASPPPGTTEPQQRLNRDAQSSRADTSKEHVSPFWNTNIPPSQHTASCPSYLLYALDNAKDQAILRTPDALYQRQTWPQVCLFVETNRLDLFQRVPSELRLYREFCWKLSEEYGSVMEFVMRKRLGWADLVVKGRGFENPDNYRILHNDWPYGVDARIVHLVIWTKFSLPSDPRSDVGDLLPETREMVQRFVDVTFGKRKEEDDEKKIVWFVNPASLKSIHSVEHFHVMLFDPDAAVVERLTGGDVPWRDVVRMERGVDRRADV